MLNPRKYYRVLLTLLIAPSFIAAQDKIPFERLKAPTAPAATIINIQPSEISRPKSIKELELAVFNNFVGDDQSIGIPNDYSIEIMPFWMVNRKNFDEINYLRKRNSFLANLSISVATTQSFRIQDSLNTNAMGFGFRSFLFRSDIDDKAKGMIVKNIYYNRFMNRVNVDVSSGLDLPGLDYTSFQDVKHIITDKLLNNFTDEMREEYGDIDKEEYRDQINIVFDWLEKGKDTLTTLRGWEEAIDTIKQLGKQDSLRNIESQLSDFLTNRAGWQVEIAGATSLNFPNNEFDFSVIPQWGLWLTANYQFKSSPWQWLLLARYLRNDIKYYQQYQPSDSVNYSNKIDFGGKIVYNRNKFSGEIEAVFRSQNTVLNVTEIGNMTTRTTRNDTDFKWMLNLHYRITETILLTYNFGKDFDPILSINGNIISTLGLNFGFGGPKIETGN
jgi:hypothetical protein